MRKFDYKICECLTTEIVALLTSISELKGKLNIVINQKPTTCKSLIEIAKIQSTESSNKIEGIGTTNDRLKLLVNDKTTPVNRDEEEILGYRKTLETIHENFEYIPVKSEYILQLHRDLYKFSGVSYGGAFKNTENVITETLKDGTTKVRFKPVDVWETPKALEELCFSYNEAISKSTISELIAMSMFILDFLCIHPFNDGNGRMSRLLTLLLMYKSSYLVGRYISIEKIIEETKDSYYKALEESSQGWHENKNDYEPFIKYMLSVIVKAYREFDARTDVLSKLSKADRVAKTINDTLGKITKQEILEICPDISEITVQRELKQLVDNKKIIKISGGRYTQYTWNREKN